MADKQPRLHNKISLVLMQSLPVHSTRQKKVNLLKLFIFRRIPHQFLLNIHQFCIFKYLYFNRLSNIQLNSSQRILLLPPKTNYSRIIEQDIGQDRLRDVLQDKHIDFQVRGSVTVNVV